MRIVFFGTPAFAAHSLEMILQAGYNVVGVITAPDKPAGQSKPWSGRFSEPVTDLVKDFTASVNFDRRLAEYDID